jgi:hypothetical protein
MNPDGPYVSVAALCESVLDEKIGRLSCIRFIDKIDVNFAVMRANAPEGTNLPPIPIPPFLVTGLISLKSGGFKGKKSIKVNVIKPSGISMNIKGDMSETFPVVFEGGSHGVNLILNLTLQTDEEGLYYFDVLLDEEMVTRIPLLVTYTRSMQSDVPRQENSTTADKPKA